MADRLTELCDVTPDRAPPADLQARHLWATPFPELRVARRGQRQGRALPGQGRRPHRRHRRDPAGDRRARNRIPAQGLLSADAAAGTEAAHQAHRRRADHVAARAGQVGGVRRRREPAPAGAHGRHGGRRRRCWPSSASTRRRTSPGAQSLHWRSGGRSVFRGVEIHGRSGVSPAPVIISGHGGGNWYNFRDGSARLLVDRAPGPLRFYQFSVAARDQRTARRAARQLLRDQVRGQRPDADRPRQRPHPPVRPRRQRQGPAPTPRCSCSSGPPNFLFANGVDGPTKIGSKSPQPSGRQHRPAPVAHAHRPPRRRRRAEAPAARTPRALPARLAARMKPFRDPRLARGIFQPKGGSCLNAKAPSGQGATSLKRR